MPDLEDAVVFIGFNLLSDVLFRSMPGARRARCELRLMGRSSPRGIIRACEIRASQAEEN
jgi:hypothetical protein